MRAAERSLPAVSAAVFALPAGDPFAGGKVSMVRVDRRTGRLVRVIFGGDESATLPKIAPPPPLIQKLVEKSSRAHDVDPLLVQSVIQVESNYNHYAVSSKGAEGLMQLMPQTARSLGVANSFDPAQNIEAGVKYLKYLQGVYGDDRLALAAYNAGPKAVDKYKWVPPYAETQDYVEQVGKRYRAAKHGEAAKQEQAAKTGPAPALVSSAIETAALEKHPKLEHTVDDYGRLVLRTAQE